MFFVHVALRRAGAVCLALVAVTLFAAPARAVDKDLSELEHYTLTMDKINHLGQVMTDFNAYAKDHPDSKNVLENDTDKGDKKDDLDALAARISRVPEVVSILRKDGFTPREFVVLEMTYVQSAMAFALKPAGETDAEYGAKVHVNPANLAFLRDHQDELKAMQSKFSSQD